MNLYFRIKTTVAITMLALASPLLKAAAPGDDLIAKGEVFDEHLQASEALQCFLPAEKLQPKNPHLLVCIARQYRHLMSDARSTGEKLKLGATALNYARRAAAAGPDSSEAQLAPGITYGKLLPLEGTGDQIEASRNIKVSCEKAIRLDPHNDLAWHVIGRWHRVVADVGALKHALGSLIYGSLPTSTNEEAVKCFEKAIQINPSRPMHYIELGRTYAQMGRASEARKVLEKGLSLRDTEKDDPETKRIGRQILATL